VIVSRVFPFLLFSKKITTPEQPTARLTHTKHMKAVVAVVVLICLLVSLAVAEFTGEGTYYDATGEGTCSFDRISSTPLLVAALNAPDFNHAANCGRCVAVRGPQGNATVVLVDQCPGCASGDLDFSLDAFVKLAPQSAGRVPITWAYVACKVAGKLQYKIKDGANRWWVAVQVRNSPVGITKLELQESGASEWVVLPRTDYNFFVKSWGSEIKVPVSIRITSVTGEVVTDIAAIEDIVESHVYAGSVQFTAQSDTGTAASLWPPPLVTVASSMVLVLLATIL
jgi:expansin (peptidoglycan-binding protein)